MKRIGTIVGDELHFLAADGEAGAGDAPGVAADDRAKAIILIVSLVVGEAAEPERHIGFPPAAVGHVDLRNDPAIADDVDLRAVRHCAGYIR